MSDKHNKESGCYDGKTSNRKCKICSVPILYSDLDGCEQEDECYICPACLSDIEAGKVRETMGRD